MWVTHFAAQYALGSFGNAACKQDFLDVDSGLVHCQCASTGFIALMASLDVSCFCVRSGITCLQQVCSESELSTHLLFSFFRTAAVAFYLRMLVGSELLVMGLCNQKGFRPGKSHRHRHISGEHHTRETEYQGS